MLTKEQRSKINKRNRAKGYAVEREDFNYWRKRGIFAFRIPSRQQRGELSTFDVIVCKPTGTECHQCKARKDLLKQIENDNHVRICNYYKMIPVLCYKIPYKGLRWEVMKLSLLDKSKTIFSH